MIDSARSAVVDQAQRAQPSKGVAESALPGLLEPDQVEHVLRERQRTQQRTTGGREVAEPVSAH